MRLLQFHIGAGISFRPEQSLGQGNPDHPHSPAPQSVLYLGARSSLVSREQPGWATCLLSCGLLASLGVLYGCPTSGPESFGSTWLHPSPWLALFRCNFKMSPCLVLVNLGGEVMGLGPRVVGFSTTSFPLPTEELKTCSEYLLSRVISNSEACLVPVGLGA